MLQHAAAKQLVRLKSLRRNQSDGLAAQGRWTKSLFCWGLFERLGPFQARPYSDATRPGLQIFVMFIVPKKSHPPRYRVFFAWCCVAKNLQRASFCLLDERVLSSSSVFVAVGAKALLLQKPTHKAIECLYKEHQKTPKTFKNHWLGLPQPHQPVPTAAACCSSGRGTYHQVVSHPLGGRSFAKGVCPRGGGSPGAGM